MGRIGFFRRVLVSRPGKPGPANPTWQTRELSRRGRITKLSLALPLKRILAHTTAW
jgi:hypothetical protein